MQAVLDRIATLEAELGSLKEAEVELDDNSSAALLLPASRNATGRVGDVLPLGTPWSATFVHMCACTSHSHASLHLGSHSASLIQRKDRRYQHRGVALRQKWRAGCRSSDRPPSRQDR